jgi:hypothetical protein
MMANAGAANGHGEPLFVKAALVATWIVSVELADELPGVSDAGENEAVAPGGSPLALNVTEPAKVPFCAITEMLYSADPPG